jgi:hypothetical protein
MRQENNKSYDGHYDYAARLKDKFIGWSGICFAEA